MRLTFALFLSLYFSLALALALAQNEGNYTRLIDSAEVCVFDDPQRALLFLDSIPAPLEKSIKGRKGKYYFLKGLAFDATMQGAKVYQSYLLSSRYAKEEEDFNTAARANLELFSNIYWLNNDTIAFKYLNTAKEFFTLAKNEDGLLEVEQMPAYAAFVENDYKKSNNLVLPKLDDYKKIDYDAYYYLFANYLLASNYIHLNELDSAQKYYKEFKSLESNPTIDEHNYKGYNVSLKICLAKLHLDNRQIDSTFYYLSAARSLKDYMTVNSLGEYYSFFSEAYLTLGEEEKSKIYLDSLKQFQLKVFDDNIGASLELNKILIESEEALREDSEKTRNNEVLLIVFGVIILVIVLVMIFGYKNLSRRLKEYLIHKKDLANLESKHEKLKVKTRGLENYIFQIKDQVKQMGTIEDKSVQRDSIRDLYRAIHAESESLSDSQQAHLELLNESNPAFFTKIKKDLPSLLDSEYLICYYLKLGFKNKEIATFLNRSVRSIESQRYRISKKLNLNNSKLLLEYLNTNY